MRVKKYLALTLAAALATCLLTACPWDIEDDASSSPSSAPSSSSRPSHDSSDDDNNDDSSSAPSSPSTPDEPKITVDNTGALQLPADKKTLSAADIEGIKDQIQTVELNGVTVQPETFEGCPNLTTVTITGGTLNASEYHGGPFKNCQNLETVTLDGVTIKGHGTFWNCEKLETVTLDGVTISGYGTFTGCESLHTVNLENNVNVADATSTFYHCRELTTVTGANTLESIPHSMFSDCFSLRYIDVSKATSIGHSAFAGCNSLEFIRVGTELETIENNAFKKHGPNGDLVPMDLTVYCTGSKETSGENLEKLFTQDVCNATFEYDCTDEKWNSIVSQSQTVVPEAGNALARYLLDLRL